MNDYDGNELIILSYKNMSLKLLCFGEQRFLSEVIRKLRAEEKEVNDEEIVVDKIQVRGKSFLTFAVFNSDLIASQATGTGALIYFLDPSQPLYQQKQLFYGVLGERRQFEGIPIVIAYDKDQNLQIKEIVNFFELFKVKDRASMIKEIDLSDSETICEIFQWIHNQVEFRKTKTFDAAPKVVKIKPKYRESEPESTEKKYEGIVKDKNMKGKNVKDQEEAYIDKEKERIKNENMEKQLANFNKNKKKMAPYDIKATPNPKIEANLHFFLKDPKVDKSQQVNIKIQTDQFKQRPKPKPYVPKKTGINTGTQIQSTELFDFDKEVFPILDILTTRALESATLEIEEEQQCLKIAKYKNAYTDRVKKQKKHENENIQIQQDTIKEKDRILELARKKDAVKKNITKKKMYYSIANNFLQGIYANAAVNLYKKNHYPNQFEHSLKIEYLPEVLSRAMVSYEKLLMKEKCVEGVFEEPSLKEVLKASEAPRQNHKKIKAEKEKRRINKGDEMRYIHISYNHPQEVRFSSFAKYFSKDSEGTLEEYVKSREEEIQEAEDKLQTEEIDEAAATQIKEKDNMAYAENHKTFMIGSEKQICFAVAQNKYEKCDQLTLCPGAIFLDKEGKIIQKINEKEPQCKYAKQVNNLRYFKDPFGVDHGVVVNLEEVPENVNSVVMFAKVRDAGRYYDENESKKMKNSVYQLEFYEKAIPIHKEDIGAQIKWEEFAKPPVEGGEGEEVKADKTEESLFIWAYHLQRKGKQFWQFEDLRQISKPIESSKSQELIDKVCNFYKQSLEIFKPEEQEVKTERKALSREKGSKRKSRKNIPSEKEVAQQQQAPKEEIKVCSRILKEVCIRLKEQWEKVENDLKDEVIDWKEFIESAPDGWYLCFRGKKLENIEQLRKFNKVGDITLVKQDPPPPEKQEVNENAEGGEEGEEQAD